MWNIISITGFTIFIILIWNKPILGEEKSLYSEGDRILELNVTNFNDKVFKQRKAFFIEFYSSWCGACIGYAPLYKKFAQQTQTWNPIVEVAAVNCADEANSKLCREHSIEAFPTIKYFKYMSAEKNDGQKYNGNKHELLTLPLDLAQLVYDDWAKQRPSEWPVFDYITQGASVEDIFNTIDNSVNYLGLVIESEPARLSWAEMINFAQDGNIRIRSINSNHPVVQKLLAGGDTKSPKFFLFKRGNPNSIYVSGENASWIDIQENVSKYLPVLSAGNVKGVVGERPENVEFPENIPSNWSQYEVQMLDLTSALFYMLKEEIPRKQVIAGDNLEGLKLWIHMLKKYAIGTLPVRKLLYRLDQWLQLQQNQITSEQWMTNLESIEMELGNPLPKNMTWMACRGSKPFLRGYTCGLWTLMHAVTVNAYYAEENNAAFKPGLEIIEPIHQFIYRYLSCEICGQHFHKHVLKTNASLISQPEDAILWLWRTHNIVNKRLAKAESDDPMFPKQLFPPPSICARCHANGEFVEKEVLDFLLRYYSTSNIKSDQPKPAPGYRISEFEDGQLVRTGAKRLNPKFAVGLDRVDRVEESERRLRRQQLDANPERVWKNLDSNDFAKPYDSSSGSRFFYIFWLSIVAAAVIFIYIKYRRNRTKFWKTFYYYNDYKLGNNSAFKP